MKVVETPLPGVLVLEPKVFGDARGHFFEVHRADRYAAAGAPGPFVQDNFSRSARGILRGLHFQEPHAQGKLVLALSGTIWDVAADVRRGSPTFGKWFGCELSDESRRQIYVPPGFAHGFLVLSERADVLYKCTDYYAPEAERAIAWNDPDLAIAWPLPPGVAAPVLSGKDAAAPRLGEAPVLPLYASDLPGR